MFVPTAAIVQFFFLLSSSAFAGGESADKKPICTTLIEAAKGDCRIPSREEAPGGHVLAGAGSTSSSSSSRSEHHRVLSPPNVQFFNGLEPFPESIAAANLACESFADSPVAPTRVIACDVTVIDSTTTPNSCVNSVIPGFSITASIPGDEMIIAGPGFFIDDDHTDSNAVGPNYWHRDTDITFTTPVPTNVVRLKLWMKLRQSNHDIVHTYTVQLFDSLGNQFASSPPVSFASFGGIYSETPIAKIRISSASEAYLVEDLCFGELIESTSCGPSNLPPQGTCGIPSKCCDPTFGLIGRDCCGSVPFDPIVSSCCGDGTIVAGNDANCAPSGTPSLNPSSQPSSSSQPSGVTSSIPSNPPSLIPSTSPSSQPSSIPSASPSNQPSLLPSGSPSNEPSSVPSSSPTNILPSIRCGLNFLPALESPFGAALKCCDQVLGLLGPDCCGFVPFDPVESSCCGDGTIVAGSDANCAPSGAPSSLPSKEPSSSSQPSSIPSASPSSQPSSIPSASPSSQPSSIPSSPPSKQPSFSSQPSVIPSTPPSKQPSSIPSSPPSKQPSSIPSSNPSKEPSSIPSSNPSKQPSSSSQPSSIPSAPPSSQPSSTPSLFPSNQPSSSSLPSSIPSTSPSNQPSSIPSTPPSTQPSSVPSASPSTQPSSIPSASPSSQPSSSSQPSVMPSTPPSKQPSAVPSAPPSKQPSSIPSSPPSSQPSPISSSLPSSPPSSFPSSEPTRLTCNFGPVCDYDFITSAEDGGSNGGILEVEETYFAVCVWHNGHYHQGCYPESLIKDVGPGQMIPGTDDREIITCGCCTIVEDGSNTKIKGSTPVCDGALDCFAAGAVFSGGASNIKKSAKKANKNVKFETCVNGDVFMEENFYEPDGGEIVSCGDCSETIVI